MSRENKTAKKQLSDPEYFYEFMGHPSDTEGRKIIGNLNFKIKMKKLNNGYLYTRDEFRECVERGLLIDSDGEGQYTDENGDWTRKWLSPSSFTWDEDSNKNMEYTHVIWYNK